MIRAGSLRHSVVIQERTLTADAYGGRTEAWATFATVWANVEPLSSSEQWRAQQVQSSVSHKVTIRYLAGIDSKMRVKHGTRYLHIGSIRNVDERNIELELLCTEAT